MARASPRVPAVARERIDVGTLGKLTARMASSNPGSSRSRTAESDSKPFLVSVWTVEQKRIRDDDFRFSLSGTFVQIDCRQVQIEDPSKIIGPLDDIIQAMAGSHGLDISRYEEAFLRKTIAKRMAATGGGTLAGYVERVAGDRAEAEMFFHSLRINHSEFFRNPLTFAVLGQLVLPGLVEAKKKSGGEIRIWSAGCASGQEAWSLAILLEELAGPVPYRIFATDLADPESARAGVYSAEAVGNVRTRHLREYFSKQGESFSVGPRLRARVDFSAYDLLDGSSSSPAASIYGGFDLILCCNVLFYYRKEARQLILDKASLALAPGGYFVTGEVERAMVSDRKNFLAVLPPAAVFRMANVSP